MKILIIALSGIGDALMFTPALQLIRKKFPDALIDALVMFKGVKENYERTKLLNNVFYFDFMNENKLKALRFVLALRNKYEYSINVYPSNRREYNLINFLVGAKYRAGTKYIRMDLINFGWLNNIRFNEDDSLHNVQENIRLSENLFKTEFNEEPSLSFPLSENDVIYEEEFYRNKNIDPNAIVIGFHAGCSTLKNHIKRRWEPKKFSLLGKKLIKKYNAKILLFGGPEENDLKREIANKINSNNCIVVEADSLSHSVAIMKRCNIFVTNDSSLMHIASALKLNVVCIIGPTSMNYIHPWKTNYKTASVNLSCSPCFVYSPKPLSCSREDVQFKCIKEVDVELVMSKVEEFLLEPTN